MENDAAKNQIKFNRATLTVGSHRIPLPLILRQRGRGRPDICNRRSETKGLQLNGQNIQGGWSVLTRAIKIPVPASPVLLLSTASTAFCAIAGYDIAELADKKIRSIETALLLIYGELPTQEEREHFREASTQSELLHEGMMNFSDFADPNADPTAILAAAVQTSSLYYPELRSIEPGNDDCSGPPPPKCSAKSGPSPLSATARPRACRSNTPTPALTIAQIFST